MPLLWAEPEPLLRKLVPVLRAQVLMTFLGLILLGVTLVLLVMVGARYVRRLARQRAGPTPVSQSDWYRQPLAQPSDDSSLDET